MKKSKMIITSLASVLLFTAIQPQVTHANMKPSSTNAVIKSNAQAGKALDDVLRNENISKEEWNRYVKDIKEQAAKEPTPRWKGAAIKKAMKFAVKHADTIPSQRVRDAVKKYGGKIINGIDNIEAYTWYGIARALTKAGVPDKYADLIADFLVQFVL